ncbi:MAG: amidohydrolase [Planctomycetaceae bacterium]|nr:amidohydrolase [Planctomycetaceae bacterium]
MRHVLQLALLLILPSYALGQGADTIFRGGDVVTVDDKRPFAEAVAIKNGNIIAVGTNEEIAKYQDVKTEVVDLAGRTLLPGFIDGHGHCFATGIQAASANLLAPPDYKITDIAGILSELKTFAKSDAAKKYGIILGFGYDDAQLAEQRHPNRHELDEVSKDIPVYVIHQSGHLGAANSKALELAGINAETSNPVGGIIRREKDGKTPDGVLEETIHYAALMKIMPKMGQAEFDGLAKAGMKLYAANGYTLAQEGRSIAPVDQSWMRLAEKKEMLIDVVSYPDISSNEKPFGLDSKWYNKQMSNGYRIAGVKISLDGSPQGKTAYLSQPYLVPPHGAPSNFRGYAAMLDQDVDRKVALCYEKGWQFIAHCNGDAASDLMIGAVKDAREKFGVGRDRRDVMIHCQTVREDQLDSMKELGIFPSMFGMHCFYWGDWHRDSVLGAARAERISPARSAMRRGMMFSQHHDSPVAMPSAIRILSSVVTRRTRSGDILGAEQCIPVDAALKSLTLWAAYQHYEEANRGSIEVGKLADFVVLDKNPHRVPIESLADLKVLQTIKEGKTVHKAPD